MEQNIRERIVVMSSAERIDLFMDIYRADIMDRKELRRLAGLDENAYEERMIPVRDEIMDEYFEEMSTEVLVDEYNRMLKEDKGL